MPRFQLSSDGCQIFAADGTAHTVHCQKKNFQKCSSYKGINIGKLKMWKKSIFELVYFYEDNRFSHWILLNNTQIFVYSDIEI